LAGILLSFTRTPQTGREFRAEQEYLGRVTEPQQQRDERGRRAEGGGLCGMAEIQADCPAAKVEEQRSHERAPQDRPPCEPLRGQVAVDQRNQSGDEHDRYREVERRDDHDNAAEAFYDEATKRGERRRNGKRCQQQEADREDHAE
jgi:hypothetical protein